MASCYGSEGVYGGSGAQIDLIANQIDGGTVNASTEGGAGVFLQGAGATRILQNRIFGGAPNATNASWGAWGIREFNTMPLEIANNFIHGGVDPLATNRMVGVGPFSRGAVIHHNTILSGFGATGAVIFLNTLATATVIETNILAGNQATATIMDSYACAGDGPVASLRDNVAFNYTNQLYYEASGTTCAAGTAFQDDSALQTEFLNNCAAGSSATCTSFGGTKAAGNLRLATTCNTDPGCVLWAGCSGVDACFASLFSSWDATTFGKSDEFSVPFGGWLLKAGDPCKVTQSGLNDTASVAQDLFGTTRTAPPSMGAYEFDGTCM
jgi:hypothetical protein